MRNYLICTVITSSVLLDRQRQLAYQHFLNGEISHDSVQRYLAGERQTSVHLWRVVKSHVRKIESAEGVLIVDDSIAEKPYTDENDIICWHYDHSQQRNVKGINFVTCLYHNAGVSLPVGFELVAKTEHYTDPKDGKEKRRSPKNQERILSRNDTASASQPDCIQICAQ